jgi:farnesyl-diphosphate farnesyltransferase
VNHGLGDLLRRVSRSFYLSLAILPRGLREPISLAYLLARAADTIADTRLLARPDRLAHLGTLRAAIAGEPRDLGALGRAVARHQHDRAERQLLERVGEAVAGLQGLSPADRREVRAVLDVLTSGMLFDLTRFPGEDARSLAALERVEELEHYTYLVAGCVGPFWTVLHVAHRPRLRGWDPEAMSGLAVRFGQALQYTNVLRDVAGDLRHGRCYLPAGELAGLGLAPADLLEPAGSARARPLLHRLLARALEHYDAGWRYTLAIPVLEWRMRLACAWPLLIGLSTLAALGRHPDPIAARPPVKISRAHVRAIIGRSAVAVLSNRRLAAEAARRRRGVMDALVDHET